MSFDICEAILQWERTFASSPRVFLCPFVIHPLICFLSLKISLHFLKIWMHEIIRHVLLGVGVWLFSFSIIILSLFMELLVSVDPFYCWWVFYLYIPKFTYLPVNGGHLSCFQFQVINSCCEHLCTNLSMDMCFIFLGGRYLEMEWQGHMLGVV